LNIIHKKTTDHLVETEDILYSFRNTLYDQKIALIEKSKDSPSNIFRPIIKEDDPIKKQAVESYIDERKNEIVSRLDLAQDNIKKIIKIEDSVLKNKRIYPKAGGHLIKHHSYIVEKVEGGPLSGRAIKDFDRYDYKKTENTP
jgi:hypothetical protein